MWPSQSLDLETKATVYGKTQRLQVAPPRRGDVAGGAETGPPVTCRHTETANVQTQVRLTGEQWPEVNTAGAPDTLCSCCGRSGTVASWRWRQRCVVSFIIVLFTPAGYGKTDRICLLLWTIVHRTFMCALFV